MRHFAAIITSLSRSPSTAQSSLMSSSSFSCTHRLSNSLILPQESSTAQRHLDLMEKLLSNMSITRSLDAKSSGRE
jgi:hypothetical protein